jgi:hypothetical protein
MTHHTASTELEPRRPSCTRYTWELLERTGQCAEARSSSGLVNPQPAAPDPLRQPPGRSGVPHVRNATATAAGAISRAGSITLPLNPGLDRVRSRNAQGASADDGQAGIRGRSDQRDQDDLGRGTARTMGSPASYSSGSTTGATGPIGYKQRAGGPASTHCESWLRKPLRRGGRGAARIRTSGLARPRRTRTSASRTSGFSRWSHGHSVDRHPEQPRAACGRRARRAHARTRNTWCR